MLKRVAFVFATAFTVLVLGSSAMAHHKPDHQQGGGNQNENQNILPLVVVQDKVEICHSRQPNPSNGQGGGPQGNPYGPQRLEVSVSSADGNPNNQNGNQPDHFGEHTGPVFDNTGQDFWGDIIPPIPGVHGGLNWTAQGQAIWNNDCQFTFADQPELEVSVVCEVVNGVLKNVVTIENFGAVQGSAFVNGVEVVVPGLSAETVEVDPGVTIVVTVDDGQGNQVPVDVVTPVCENGRGGEDPETPVTVASVSTPQVDAPKGGAGAGGGAVMASLAGLGASIGSLGYGVMRFRKSA